MGQYWEIVNFDDAEKFSKGGGSKLGEFFWDPDLDRLICLLKLPPCTGESNPLRGWATEPQSKCSKAVANARKAAIISGSKLLRLPAEVLSMIIDKFDAYDPTLLSFCLAHERLGSLGEQQVYNMLLTWYAPWAGSRIACIGNYIRDDDYPPTLQPIVTKELDSKDAQEQTDVTATQNDAPLDKPTRHDSSDFYSIAAGTYPCIGAAAYLPRFVKKMIDKTALTLNDQQKFDRLMVGLEQFYKHKDSADADDIDVLCNLSKHVYVRGDAVEGLHQKLVVPIIEPYSDWAPGITLAQVLLSQICWSSDNSCAMACNDERLTRGPWAGDNFEVVSLKVLRHKIGDGSEWSDVTNDVLAWVEELWGA